MKRTYIKVSRRLNTRKYTYTAYLTQAGTLSFIKAGCRKWLTFEGAQAYYRGEHASTFLETVPRWSDEWTNTRRRAAERYEARELLSRLETDVREKQRRVRRKRQK